MKIKGRGEVTDDEYACGKSRTWLIPDLTLEDPKNIGILKFDMKKID